MIPCCVTVEPATVSLMPGRPVGPDQQDSPATPAITDQYTLVGLKRRAQLTRRVLEKRAKADRNAKVVEMKKEEAVA